MRITQTVATNCLTILFILFMTVMTACQSTTTTNTNKLQQDITYFKDEKTGLCFAAVNSKTQEVWQIVSITQVPCTPEVLAEINKQNAK